MLYWRVKLWISMSPVLMWVAIILAYVMGLSPGQPLKLVPFHFSLHKPLQATKKGWTALHFAAILMDLRAIEILLQYRCDTTRVTEVCNTCTCKFTWQAICILLMQLHSTPLHFVTGRFGNRGDHLRQYVSTIMRTLIEAGVDPMATNSVSMIHWCKHVNMFLIANTVSARSAVHLRFGNKLYYCVVYTSHYSTVWIYCDAWEYSVVWWHFSWCDAGAEHGRAF